MPSIPVLLVDRNHRLEARNANLSGSSFNDVNLSGAIFDDVKLSDATFNNVNLTNLRITDANTTGMTIEGVLLSDLQAAYRAART